MVTTTEYFKRRRIGLRKGNRDNERCGFCGVQIHRKVLRFQVELNRIPLRLCPRCFSRLGKSLEPEIKMQEKYEYEMVAKKI